MYIKRKVEQQLLSLMNNKKAILLLGARQVGKTYILKKHIQNNYKRLYYLNLYQNVEAIKILIGAKNIDDFLLRLSGFSDVIIDKETGIFIDEIEEYYIYLGKHPEIEEYFDIITQTKFLIEQEYNIFLSGSLLKLELEGIISYPVGYLVKIEMYPLDFEEFLWANGINEKWIDILKDCFKNKKEVPDFIHTKILSLFKLYLLVGGMPDAVYQLITTKSFVAIENAHRAINGYIINDIIRYASEDEKLKIKEIYDIVPTELNTMSKRFIMSHISDHKKNDNEVLSFTWLTNAGVAIPAFMVDEPTIPLKASSKRNKLKLFHEDVGLLTYLIMDYSTKVGLLDSKITINYGSIYENAVAELLHAHDFSELYYYDNKKNGEVDFVLEKNAGMYLIEIKSGKDYLRHNALNNLLKIDNYKFKDVLVFHDGNVKNNENITYFPIYLIEFMYKKTA